MARGRRTSANKGEKTGHSTENEAELLQDFFSVPENWNYIIVESFITENEVAPNAGSEPCIWLPPTVMNVHSISCGDFLMVARPANSSQSSIMQLAKLIKKEITTDSNAMSKKKNPIGEYFAVCQVWPSPRLPKNSCKVSSHVLETLGSPKEGSSLLCFPTCERQSQNSLTLLLCKVQTDFEVCLHWIKPEAVHCATPESLAASSTGISVLTRELTSSPKTPVRSIQDDKQITPRSAKSQQKKKSVWQPGNMDALISSVETLLAGKEPFSRIFFEKFIARWLLGRSLLPGNVVVIPICGMRAHFEVEISSPAENPAFDFVATDLGRTIDIFKVGFDTRLTLVSGDSNSTLDRDIVSQPDLEVGSIQPTPLPSRSRDIKFSSLGGLAHEISALRELIELPLKNPDLFQQFGIRPPRGVLLHGPPGTGKTTLAKAVANEFGAAMFVINGPELVSEYFGESEKGIKLVFDKAQESAPSIVFIDEIDAIASSRSMEGEDLTKRIVAALLTILDGGNDLHRVIVIAATNRVDVIDPALRRPGRFDRELEIGVPTPSGRLEILETILSRMKHNLTLDQIKSAAVITHGFVGADLHALCNEAAMSALRKYVATSRNFPLINGNVESELKGPEETSRSLESDFVNLSLREEAEDLVIEWSDFESARSKIRPSALREVLIEVPKVRWSDIGGNDDIKQSLQEAMEWPQKHSEAFSRVGAIPPKGVLLYGPPGCSKTLMARAVATEVGLNFLAVKGPELFSKFVGESEKAVRSIFSKARSAAPAVIFFDEIDGLASVRSNEGSSGGGTEVNDRVLSQLLMEMDGLNPLNGVSIIAATNRPDLIDSALLRPGRFDRLLYVGLPDGEAREQIFRVQLRTTPYDVDIDFGSLSRMSDGFSGADIALLCREAAFSALEEDISCNRVCFRHFERAFPLVVPNPSASRVQFYESFRRGQKN